MLDTKVRQRKASLTLGHAGIALAFAFSSYRYVYFIFSINTYTERKKQYHIAIVTDSLHHVWNLDNLCLDTLQTLSAGAVPEKPTRWDGERLQLMLTPGGDRPLVLRAEMCAELGLG